MRTVAAGLLLSVDGVVGAPDLLPFDSVDADLGAMTGRMIGPVDTAVLGRTGYEDERRQRDADLRGARGVSRPCGSSTGTAR